MSRSAYPFCHGERGKIGWSRIPHRSTLFHASWPTTDPLAIPTAPPGRTSQNVYLAVEEKLMSDTSITISEALWEERMALVGRAANDTDELHYAEAGSTRPGDLVDV